MVGFFWLPARAVVLIAAAFWESRASQAFSALSSLVLEIVLVLEIQINQWIDWPATYCCQSLEAPSLMGLDGLREFFGSCFSGDAFL